MKKRLLASFLSLVLILGLLPTAALAAGTGDDGLCPHHTEHTAECGYAAPTEGTPCTHVHAAECYSDGSLPADDEEKEADACAHVHDTACGYSEGSEGSPCTFVCSICPVEAMIEALPTYADATPEDVADIEAAQAAYDGLTEEEQAAVDSGLAAKLAALSELAVLLADTQNTIDAEPLDNNNMRGSCGAKDNENDVTWVLTANSDNPTTYTLTISGKGAMRDYAKNADAVTEDKPLYTSAPWRTCSALSTEAIDIEGTTYDGTYRTGITKIVVEDGVTRIGSSAFSFMRDVTEITIADSVTSIGDRAFMYNYSLESITIPDSVEMDTLLESNQDGDGELLLGHCYSLKDVTLGSGFTVIPCRAFEGTNIRPEQITMDRSKITGIGTQAFYNNTMSAEELDLTSFSSLKELKTNTFSFWTIERVKFPASLEELGSFNTVKGLSEVNWTDLTSLKEIADNAFKGTEIKTADLSSTKITDIGWGAFENCASLATVVLPDTVTAIEGNAFIGLPAGSTITVPEDKYTLLTGKYTPENTSIITVGTSVPGAEETIGLTHNGRTTFFSSLASAANNAVSGDTIFATGAYTFGDNEVAVVRAGVTLTGGNLSGYGATFANDERTAYCGTLQTALASCEDGDTVTLNRDVTVSGNIRITKSVTIDLNQKTVTSSAWAAPFLITSGVTCTIQDGTIYGSNSNKGICVDTQDGSTTTLSNVTLTNGNEDGNLIRVRSGIVVLDDVDMADYGLYTVREAEPTVFFTGTNRLSTNVIDGLGTWSLYFDSGNTGVLTQDKSNAIRYFLNCALGDLTSYSSLVNKEGKIPLWYSNSDLSGDPATSTQTNDAYYAKWTECTHNESKVYTTTGATITEKCSVCDAALATATITAPDDLVYDGTAKTATVTTSVGWQGGELTPTYNSEASAPINAGTYTASITVGGATAEVNFTIAKASTSVGIETDKDTLSGGGTVTLTVTETGLPDGATVSVTGNNGANVVESNGTYTANLPNTTATYTFTASYAGSENYSAATASCTVSVTQYTGGGGSSSSGSSSSNVSGSGDDVSISASGGSVTSSQMESAVNKADEGSTITIKATSSTTVSLPVGGMADAADNDNDVLLDLRYGEVTLSARTIAGLTDGVSSSGKIKVSVANQTSSKNETISDLLDKGAAVFDVTVEVDGVEIHSFDGTLTITLTVSNLSKISDPHVLHILTNGTKEYYAPDRISGNTITVTGIRNLSTFAVIPGSEVPQSNPFTDVSTSDYYYDAVLWAADNGVTGGTSATTFSPNVTVTRAQMVTFLWRAHGSPKATGANPFTDVSTSDYYYDAVLWAVANGVTNGTSATTFSPDAPVTRAQAVTFQWRAAGSPVVSGSSFGDVAADAYYVNAVTWAVANGITNGTSDTTFSPDVVVSRAQAVTFLWRELA